MNYTRCVITATIALLMLLAYACGGQEADQASTQPTAGGETTVATTEELSFPETTQQTTTETTSSGGQGSEGDKGAKKQDEDRPSTLVKGAQDNTNGPLKTHRMVSYYGHPFSQYMGVLGQYNDPENMMADLEAQAQAYTEADPDLPAKPTIELIASVAQAEPGPDGLYMNRTPDEVIAEYAQVAKEHDALLLLDIQPGYSTIADEVEALEEYLRLPYVHLAVDPEWDMAPGEVPGQTFGQSDAREIMDVANTLNELVKKEDIPDKVLVVHQFRDDMITNKELLRPLDHVQVAVHADGFGSPANKLSKYRLLVTQQPVQYGGFKLFYTQDVPLLSPEEVLNELNPPPAVISYQ